MSDEGCERPMQAGTQAVGEPADGGSEWRARLAAIDAAAKAAERVARSLAGEIAELKRGLAEQHEARERDAEHWSSADQVVLALHAEIDAAAARTSQEFAELRQVVVRDQAARAEDAGRLHQIEQLGRQAQAAPVAATEAAGGSAHAVALATADRVEHEVAAMRQEYGTQQQTVDWTQGQLRQARRVVVKLARRVRAMATAAEARARERDQNYDHELAVVRADTSAALAMLREQHAALAGRVDACLADLPSRADQQALRAFLDACEARFGQLAARLDSWASAPAPDDDARLAVQLADLATVTARLDAEQHRLAADVEERLRALMRTAAGGFDVQLALLRGKVEMLARTMRERGSADPAAPLSDEMLEQRGGLLERLRQQLTSLQSGAGWSPQHVLDLLIDSTLAVAVTPLRRMVHLADEGTPADDETKPSAASTTDESAAPSSDP
jgi:hypothetical protein